jgi:AmiR/NasT family two-component response regulator
MASDNLSRTFIKALRTTQVVLLHPPDDDGNSLEHQLRRIGCRVRSFWPPPASPVRDADVVYFLADPEHPDLHQPYSDDRSAALIAIVAFESPLEVQAIVEANVHGTVAKPIQPIGVLSCLASAMSQHRYEKRLSARVEKLDELLKTRRLVERATQILATHRQISEHEAAAMLRRQAMNKQISLYEMATSIINADRLLGDS